MPEHDGSEEASVQTINSCDLKLGKDAAKVLKKRRKRSTQQDPRQATAKHALDFDEAAPEYISGPITPIRGNPSNDEGEAVDEESPSLNHHDAVDEPKPFDDDAEARPVN